MARSTPLAWYVLVLATLAACGSKPAAAPDDGTADAAGTDALAGDAAAADGVPDAPDAAATDAAADGKAPDGAGVEVAEPDSAPDAGHDLDVAAEDVATAEVAADAAVSDGAAPDDAAPDVVDADDAAAPDAAADVADASDAGDDAATDALESVDAAPEVLVDVPDVPKCTPFCLPGSCADDGCGKPCACGSGLSCDGAGTCTTCGQCAPGYVCNVNAQTCDGDSCLPGPDDSACDVSGQVATNCVDQGVMEYFQTSSDCATKGKGWKCYKNAVYTKATCLPPPDCTNKQCGPDGIGGVCGTCGGGLGCSTDQKCIDIATTCGTCAGWATCGGSKGANVCQGSAAKCISVPQSGQCENNNLFEICTGTATFSTDCGFVSGGKDYCGVSVKTGQPGCIPKPQCSGKACGWDGAGISCGTCPSDKACDASGQCVSAPTPGDTCASPIGFTFPATLTGTTLGFTDSYWTTGDCPASTGGYHGITLPDAVYSFSTTGGTFKFSLLPNGSPDMPTALYVSSTCGNLANSCVAYSGDLYNNGTGGSMTVKLASAGTYFVFVDGLHAGDVGPYTFKAEEVCAPNCVAKTCGDDGCGGSCGDCSSGACISGNCGDPDFILGNNCALPNLISPVMPADVTGTTIGFSDDFSNNCGDAGQVGLGAPDAAFSFTPILDGVYKFSLSASFNGAIYVKDDCASGPWSCLASAKALTSGDPGVAFAKLSGLTSYSIIVDGVTAQDQGGFTLQTDYCTPNCAGKLCGFDGCGGSCGDCGSGQACTSLGQCVPKPNVPGATCTMPFALSALPYATSGTLQFATDSYMIVAENTCKSTFWGNGIGDGYADLVYAWTPPTDGAFNVTVHGTAAYIVTDCSQTASTCVGGMWMDSNATVLGKAGVTYFIILEALKPYTVTAKIYDIEVTACVPQCAGKNCGSDGCGGTCGSCGPSVSCDETAGFCTAPSCKHRCGHVFDSCSCDGSGTACADYCAFCALDAPQKCTP